MTVGEPDVAASDTVERASPRTELRAAGDEPAVVERFVGRLVDLQELTAVVDAAHEGRGQLVLLSGEPGIGKTRLVEEAARYAAVRDVSVVWGRAWQGGGAPAFWPWVQVLRELIDGDEAVGGERAGGAAALLLGNEAAEQPLGAHAAESDRFAVFDAVVGFLRAAAQNRPLLIVLDDLQWADTSSLLLLEFVARHVHGNALAVVGTFRDTEVDPAHPLCRLAGELAAGCTRIKLRGLELEEVAALLDTILGGAADPELARSLTRRTGGNPFFLRELMRLFTRHRSTGRFASADAEALPDSVRDAVRSRVDHLPDAARPLLTAAAVVGRASTATLLASVAGEDEERILGLLAEHVRAGLVVEHRAGTDRWGFAHDLVREALYEDLDPAQRRGLHHLVGVALERHHETDLRPHLAELAYHFAHGLAGDRGKAIDYSIRAGKQALAQFACEAAVEQFARALELGVSEPEASERLAALLGLAEAHRRAGDTDAARETFQTAAEVARHRGDGAGLAHAALGYGALWGEWESETNRRLLLLLGEALDALDPADSRLRARVLARLSRAHYFGKDTAAADRLSLAAVQMARRLPEAATLAETLVARHDALWVPGDPTPRLGVAAELLEAARDCGDDELALQAHAVRFTALLERGDAVDADSELDAYERLAETLKQPRYQWYAMSRRAVRAIMTGRFTEGEQLALEALALGQRAHEPEAEPMFFDARRTLGRHRGFDDRDLAAHVGYASRYPNQPIFRAAAAHIAAELGRAEQAAGLLDRLLVDLDELPRDWLWTPTVCLLAETVARLGDATRAGFLIELLAPYADLHVVESGATAYDGAVAHVLGRLATSLDHLDEAVDHFWRARAMHARIGARPYRADTEWKLAQVLLRRGEPGDAHRARDLLASAGATAEELGMPVLADEIASGAAGDVRPSADRARANVFRRDGDVWTLAYGGQTVRLRHVRGLGDLAQLVGHPGRDFHVLELVSASRPPAAADPAGADEPGLAVGDGSGDAVLDEQAVTAYRARLEDLEAEIAAAERHRDTERAARAREEQQLIAAELAAGLGLGDRPRSFTHPAERARKAVGNRIRSALRRIENHHPDLARHLRSSVRLGVFCSYQPTEPTRWR